MSIKELNLALNRAFRAQGDERPRECVLQEQNEEWENEGGSTARPLNTAKLPRLAEKA